MRKFKTLLSLSIVAGLSLMACMASAQTINTAGTASIDVQPALTVTLVASPDWGKVTRPSSGTARYTLNYSTGATTLTSGTGHAFSNGANGSYTVGGTASSPVSFSVSIGAFSGSGITVVASHINGTSGSGTGSLDGGGALTLLVGGVLDVASTATVAVQTATVTVSVDYQ